VWDHFCAADLSNSDLVLVCLLVVVVVHIVHIIIIIVFIITVDDDGNFVCAFIGRWCF